MLFLSRGRQRTLSLPVLLRVGSLSRLACPPLLMLKSKRSRLLKAFTYAVADVANTSYRSLTALKP